ncbi:hypothetical protein E4U43_002553 [Claviceps pusilla]|uniref:Uncharacterized protein n=1 Tax=Claviceps pusilla TaxID=123648 RepID=A0A9P7N8Q5_9HYPO|nr:hypothetical protein E4U43_002553 [Claviceps pusilla]
MTLKGSNHDSSGKKGRRLSDYSSASPPQTCFGYLNCHLDYDYGREEQGTWQHGQRKSTATLFYSYSQLLWPTKWADRSFEPGLEETASPFIILIVDEPRVQRFDSAEASNAGRDGFDKSVLAETENDSNDNNNIQRWPSPRRETLTIGPAQTG